jgi:hypothetical protein
MKRLEVYVEELVLHGFAPGDRRGIALAVEGELARLLAEHGVPPALTKGGMIASLEMGEVQVAASSAEAIGAQVAQAIYGGWG